MFLPILAFTTDPMIAFGVALLIFLITMFLVAKQIIGFSMTFLLLIFALVTGILMNNHTSIDSYLSHENVVDTSIIENIKKEMNEQNQAIINRLNVIEKDLSLEREERKQVANSIQEMKNQFDAFENHSESPSGEKTKVSDNTISAKTNMMS